MLSHEPRQLAAWLIFEVRQNQNLTMPGRIIVVYILMSVRLLVNTVLIARTVSVETAAAKIQLPLATIEFAFALFVLIALLQRKYLAIRVFRPGVMISGIITIIGQAWIATQKDRAGAAMPYAPLVGGLAFLIFIYWFQSYVASPLVRSYLSEQPEATEPPVLPTPTEPNKAPEPTATSVTSPAAQEPRQP